MNRIIFYIALLIAMISSVTRADDSTTLPEIHVNHAGLSKLGWQLACIGSTFRDRPTFDLIDLLHSMNFHHMELSTGQIDPSDVDGLVTKLKSVHMDIVSIGIVDPGATEETATAFFELGKRLKIKTLVVDPTDDSLDMLDKLANDYRINVAIVNFAKPGNHWDPQAVSHLLEGHSSRLGVCANVAAWRASGISPVDAVRQLTGHIMEVRLESFDTPDAADALGELKNEKFKGICAVGCASQPQGTLIDRFTSTINAFSKSVGDLSGLQ